MGSCCGFGGLWVLVMGEVGRHNPEGQVLISRSNTLLCVWLGIFCYLNLFDISVVAFESVSFFSA